MKIAIFIEPSNEINKKIIKWKKLIKRSFGNQKYSNHPVHLTLAVYKFKKRPTNFFYNSLKKDISIIKKFNIYLSKANVFYNDELINGNTLYFSVKKKQKIFNLQKKIILNFKNLRKNMIIKRNFKNLKLNKNSLNYGFPFVGKIWIPHLTVSSISLSSDKNKMSKLIEDFLSQKIHNKKIKVNKISIWKINGDRHKKIYSFSMQ